MRFLLAASTDTPPTPSGHTDQHSGAHKQLGKPSRKSKITLASLRELNNRCSENSDRILSHSDQITENSHFLTQIECKFSAHVDTAEKQLETCRNSAAESVDKLENDTTSKLQKLFAAVTALQLENGQTKKAHAEQQRRTRVLEIKFSKLLEEKSASATNVVHPPVDNDGDTPMTDTLTSSANAPPKISGVHDFKADEQLPPLQNTGVQNAGQPKMHGQSQKVRKNFSPSLLAHLMTATNYLTSNEELRVYCKLHFIHPGALVRQLRKAYRGPRWGGYWWWESGIQQEFPGPGARKNNA